MRIWDIRTEERTDGRTKKSFKLVSQLKHTDEEIKSRQLIGKDKMLSTQKYLAIKCRRVALWLLYGCIKRLTACWGLKEIFDKT